MYLSSMFIHLFINVKFVQKAEGRQGDRAFDYIDIYVIESAVRLFFFLSVEIPYFN